ncbi:MAG: hypothetical protein CMI03_16605 [Oceanospirillaceae bacterium]|uniref:hypothetical protein n=1 Tax=unclassified Thalassolituus TaxID=2624967 RepID=UPI000C4A41C2|nr:MULTISPECIES: hypothetical protein [unclassified Thalassolituus]MAS25307.1 hypothetical protein [Oceanospirillaceae bacterium]MBL33284.1 hypothetical protein [Oceanospirillaceae bacterium]MBS54362.1 hypothetical protein [Oceanospirillaceae bacterium]|tara:strand:- start:9074 stop:10306 length:1233 start_codon:yes stop_codon:yes gene_type:complete
MTSDTRSTFNTLPRTLCLAVALTIAPLTIAPLAIAPAFAQTAMAADAHNDVHNQESHDQHQHEHQPEHQQGNQHTEQADQDWRQAMEAGQSVGIDGHGLKISDISLTYPANEQGQHLPDLRVTLTNTSDQPIANAELGARLYIPGRATPVVDSEASDAFHVLFRNQPLQPGDSRRMQIDIEIPHSGWWVSADILNAKQRQLILKVDSAAVVGEQHQHGHSETTFAGLDVHSGLDTTDYRRAPADVVLPSEQALRQAFTAGQNIALNNDKLQISDIRFNWTQDDRGNFYPDIRATVRNISAGTVSQARLHAQVYASSDVQSGSALPLIDTSARPMSIGPVYAFFGEYGLESGDATRVSLVMVNKSDLQRWQKALMQSKEPLQLVLQADHLSGGMDRKLPSVSQPFSLLAAE